MPSVYLGRALCMNQIGKLISKEFSIKLEGSVGNHFMNLDDAKSFEELVSRSQESPVVVFKHSTTCPISAAAYEQMTHFNGEVALVDVQSASEVSREIEKKTGVPHESPQVLVLLNGKVIWNASHWKVKADAVAEAIRENS